MITDKERREVANKLRERTKHKLAKGESMQHMFSETLSVYRTYDYGEFGLVKESATWKNIVNLLADLIDRPSIKPEKVGPVYWRCPRCGKINYKFVILGDCGPLPSHNCAYCGAVIADD